MPRNVIIPNHRMPYANGTPLEWFDNLISRGFPMKNEGNKTTIKFENLNPAETRVLLINLAKMLDTNPPQNTDFFERRVDRKHDFLTLDEYRKSKGISLSRAQNMFDQGMLFVDRDPGGHLKIHSTYPSEVFSVMREREKIRIVLHVGDPVQSSYEMDAYNNQLSDTVYLGANTLPFHTFNANKWKQNLLNRSGIHKYYRDVRGIPPFVFSADSHRVNSIVYSVLPFLSNPKLFTTETLPALYAPEVYFSTLFNTKNLVSVADFAKGDGISRNVARKTVNQWFDKGLIDGEFLNHKYIHTVSTDDFWQIRFDSTKGNNGMELCFQRLDTLPTKEEKFFGNSIAVIDLRDAGS